MCLGVIIRGEKIYNGVLVQHAMAANERNDYCRRNLFGRWAAALE